MLHNVEEEARMKGILEVLDKNLRLALKIDEVVGRLSEKRVTLEEKMIRSYFHQVGANLLELSAWLNRALAAATTPLGEPAVASDPAAAGDGCKAAKLLSTAEIQAESMALDQLLDRLEPSIDELLKVLRYDLNFVEQYFEFNYLGKLNNEEHFLPDSQNLLNHLKSAVKAS